MLELEIKALKEEVIELRLTVSEFIAALREGPTGQPDAAPVDKTPAKTEKPKVAKVEKPKGVGAVEVNNAVEPEAAPATRESIQELCTGLIRTDRSKRDTIKDIIASYDGATNLRMVKDDDLAELYAKIEAL